MQRCAKELAAILAFLVSWQAHAQGVPTLDERAALTASQAVVGSVPADFTLLNRTRQPVRLSNYRGKPLLVSFMFTACFTVCPTQTRTLHESVKGLDRMLGPNQFNVVSIGFNQPFDTPKAMASFAAKHLIDYPNWAFLSPHVKHVADLTRAYGFSLVATPAGFDHIVGVTIVDAEGRIHGQVYGKHLTAQALGVPLRELILATPAAAGLPSVDELLARVRILCTVYDPDTGEYRYDWTLLLQVFGGLAFFFSVAVYLWREWRTQRRAARQAADKPVHAPEISAGA